MRAQGSGEGLTRVWWGCEKRWMAAVGNCRGAFWEVVMLRPSLWLSMRNGESVTGAKWSWQPTGLTSSAMHTHIPTHTHTRTHTHTYTDTHAGPHHIKSLALPFVFFYSSIILFWKNTSSCFVSLRATSALKLSCVHPAPTGLYLKTFVWLPVGPRADFGRQAGADRDKLHNAEWAVCQEANGRLKKKTKQRNRVCLNAGSVEPASGKYPVDTVVL